jgi:hypothetical protein
LFSLDNFGAGGPYLHGCNNRQEEKSIHCQNWSSLAVVQMILQTVPGHEKFLTFKAKFWNILC